MSGCCDSQCLWKSDSDLKDVTIGQWKNAEMICPVGTKKITFNCVNAENSENQGGCGIDEIKLWKTPVLDPLNPTNKSSTPEPACKIKSNRERLLAQVDALKESEIVKA